LLKQGELTVTELTSKCSTSQPNASKHLKVLTDHGILRRDQRGNAVFYSIADESIFDLCDLVCDSIGERLQAQAKIFAVS
jgi:DNA-binding transcriptional ArsR family regulator